jgi:hypothetical protein
VCVRSTYLPAQLVVLPETRLKTQSTQPDRDGPQLDSYAVALFFIFHPSCYSKWRNCSPRASGELPNISWNLLQWGEKKKMGAGE